MWSSNSQLTILYIHWEFNARYQIWLADISKLCYAGKTSNGEKWFNLQEVYIHVSCRLFACNKEK